MNELELACETAELLPTREALGANFGVGDVITVTQLNIVVAINFGDGAQDIDASQNLGIDS